MEQRTFPAFPHLRTTVTQTPTTAGKQQHRPKKDGADWIRCQNTAAKRFHKGLRHMAANTDFHRLNNTNRQFDYVRCNIYLFIWINGNYLFVEITNREPHLGHFKMTCSLSFLDMCSKETVETHGLSHKRPLLQIGQITKSYDW